MIYKTWIINYNIKMIILLHLINYYINYNWDAQKSKIGLK